MKHVTHICIVRHDVYTRAHFVRARIFIDGLFCYSRRIGSRFKVYYYFFFFNEMYTPIKVKQTYFSIKKDVLPYFF